jgi:hypothetical protein
MDADGDPEPAVEPSAAFYGIWPKFPDPPPEVPATES